MIFFLYLTMKVKGLYEMDNLQKKDELHLYIQEADKKADEMVERLQKEIKSRHDEKNAIAPQCGDKK